ncbi:SIS domain-containing protein [Candidatus Dependentiae bacterium]
MIEELTLWSQKIKDGLQLAHDFHFQHSAQLPSNIKKIAFVGMGGSGIAGKIIKTFLDKKTTIPSFIINSPELPNFIDTDTLVFAASYSGNTWETVDVLKQLSEKFIPTIVLSNNGQAAQIAEAKNLPFILLPKSMQPRTALGNFLGIIMGLLSLMDILPEGIEILKTFIKQSNLHVAKFSEDKGFFDEFIQISNNCDFFHIWGVSSDTQAFAYRAQTQFNENSKIQAVNSTLPECCHNLINGFDKFNKKPLVLLYYTDFLTANLDIALQATCDLLKEQGVLLYKPPVLGDTWEGQLFYTILWSDFASYYLGKKRGVDIARVEVIEKLKQKHIDRGIK